MFFKRSKLFLYKAHPKWVNTRVGQLSWQSFIRDVYLLKYEIPLNNTNFAQWSILSSDSESINSIQNLFENNELNDDVEKN